MTQSGRRRNGRDRERESRNLELERDRESMIRTEEGGEGRSVNDMYTQTGRTADQKEGKTARKTKRGKLPKELD